MLVLAALPLVVLAAGPAAADRDSRREGDCSRRSEWRVEASREDGRIELQAEVDSDRPGQVWSWKLLHNGYRSSRGTARTESSGTFEVERTMTDLAGTDTFSLRARNPRSGERCRGEIRL